jgi:t-SNARE complex subunit (syntaxin)
MLLVYEVFSMKVDLPKMASNPRPAADMALQVERAKTFVDRGTEHITVAKEKQKNTRKWKMWCCIVLTLILIIVGVVVGVTVARNIRAAQAATQGATSGRRLLRLVMLPEQQAAQQRIT